jgi:hypothetical protein
LRRTGSRHRGAKGSVRGWARSPDSFATIIEPRDGPIQCSDSRPSGTVPSFFPFTPSDAYRSHAPSPPQCPDPDTRRRSDRQMALDADAIGAGKRASAVLQLAAGCLEPV